MHPQTDGDEKSERETNGKKQREKTEKEKQCTVEPVENFFRFLNLKAY